MTSFSTRLIAATAAATATIASLALAAAPATAAPKEAAKRNWANQRYCFAEVMDGPTLRRNVCDTRAGWLHRGVDPLRYLRQEGRKAQ